MIIARSLQLRHEKVLDQILELLNMTMPPAVRTRRASTVVPLPSSSGGGGAGTPSVDDVVVPLSPMDTRWAALPPVCHVFLFPTAAAHQQQVPFSDVVRGLRSALAAVLPAFHTLAGELAYSPELGTVTIVCGPDAGVAFVEAETDLGLTSLVSVQDDGDGAADVDVDALPQLVPDIRREELPAPIFAAQVTEFAGGIALGVALNHVATDGIGFFRFMQMWAAASAVAAGASTSGWTWTEPLHDRRFVRFNGDQELARRLLRQAAPDLPRIVPKQQAPMPRLSRRTFTFSAHALRRLKQRLTVTFAGPGVIAGAAAAPSTFATLAAHGWVSFAHASGFTDAAPVFAVFLADCRAHMSPRVPDAYAGNCVVSCVVALSGAELTGADGPALAFLAIRDAAAEVKRHPLAGSGSWITRFRAAPPGRKVVLAGSPWFPAYEVDFGIGRPARVERASLDQDGAMAIFAGREAGSVQASVAVAAWKMPAFHTTFAVKCGSNKARL